MAGTKEKLLNQVHLQNEQLNEGFDFVHFSEAGLQGSDQKQTERFTCLGWLQIGMGGPLGGESQHQPALRTGAFVI